MAPTGEKSLFLLPFFVVKKRDLNPKLFESRCGRLKNSPNNSEFFL